MFNAVGNAVGNVLAKIFPDSVAGGKKPSGGNKSQGKKGGGNPNQGMRSRRVQEASASAGARAATRQRTMGRDASAGRGRPDSFLARQAAMTEGKQAKPSVQQRGADGLTEG